MLHTSTIRRILDVSKSQRFPAVTSEVVGVYSPDGRSAVSRLWVTYAAPSLVVEYSFRREVLFTIVCCQLCRSSVEFPRIGTLPAHHSRFTNRSSRRRERITYSWTARSRRLSSASLRSNVALYVHVMKSQGILHLAHAAFTNGLPPRAVIAAGFQPAVLMVQRVSHHVKRVVTRRHGGRKLCKVFGADHVGDIHRQRHERGAPKKNARGLAVSLHCSVRHQRPDVTSAASLKKLKSLDTEALLTLFAGACQGCEASFDLRLGSSGFSSVSLIMARLATLAQIAF